MCIGMYAQYLPLILSWTILLSLFIIMEKLFNCCSFKFSVPHVFRYVRGKQVAQYKVNLCYIIISIRSICVTS